MKKRRSPHIFYGLKTVANTVGGSYKNSSNNGNNIFKYLLFRKEEQKKDGADKSLTNDTVSNLWTPN